MTNKIILTLFAICATLISPPDLITIRYGLNGAERLPETVAVDPAYTDYNYYKGLIEAIGLNKFKKLNPDTNIATKKAEIVLPDGQKLKTVINTPLPDQNGDITEVAVIVKNTELEDARQYFVRAVEYPEQEELNQDRYTLSFENETGATYSFQDILDGFLPEAMKYFLINSPLISVRRNGSHDFEGPEERGINFTDETNASIFNKTKDLMIRLFNNPEEPDPNPEASLVALNRKIGDKITPIKLGAWAFRCGQVIVEISEDSEDFTKQLTRDTILDATRVLLYTVDENGDFKDNFLEFDITNHNSKADTLSKIIDYAQSLEIEYIAP